MVMTKLVNAWNDESGGGGDWDDGNDDVCINGDSDDGKGSVEVPHCTTAGHHLCGDQFASVIYDTECDIK